MDSLGELAWTLAVIAVIDVGFILWLSRGAAKRGRSAGIVASAELLGARARRLRS